MTNTTLTHFDILEAKKAYERGENVTDILKKQKNLSGNTPEIIEASYDLQSGTYIKETENDKSFSSLIAREIAETISSHVTSDNSLLDVGTGEMTTLSLVMQHVSEKPRSIHAFDISWSRMHDGIAYAREHMGNYFKQLTPFVADIGEIPLLDKSVDVTISSHALEPNGDKLEMLLEELFRVTRDKLVLFEPCYEINSKAGKERMERLGYIKNVDSSVEKLGGTLIEKVRMKNIRNPLNPTVCFVIQPPKTTEQDLPKDAQANIFSVPGTNHPIEIVDNFYFSNKTGLCFPILKSIPILRSKHSILASSLSKGSTPN